MPFALRVGILSTHNSELEIKFVGTNVRCCMISMRGLHFQIVFVDVRLKSNMKNLAPY